MTPKVITIAQQKGGTGKTTLAVHLALAFIKYHNLKVAIIDTDPQGSLGKWFMIRSEMNVTNGGLTFKTASLWGAQYESKILKQQHDIVIIDTPMQNRWKKNPKAKKQLTKMIPLQRIGKPNDIANTILFLLSNEGSYITGTEILVDGGLTAKP